jgi:hypothetical protein
MSARLMLKDAGTGSALAESVGAPSALAAQLVDEWGRAAAHLPTQPR